MGFASECYPHRLCSGSVATVAHGSSAGIVLRTAHKSVATTTEPTADARESRHRCNWSTPAAATAAAPTTTITAHSPSAVAAGSEASAALPPGQYLPGGTGPNRTADVPGGNEPAEDLRRHPGHVSENVEYDPVSPVSLLLPREVYCGP